MKRFYKFLMPALLLIALAVPLGSRAQETVTVAQGTTTNSYVPIYGLWMDDFTRSQMIYPDTMLTDLPTGSVINSLTFYSNTGTATSWTSQMSVRLAEVDNTTLSAYLDLTDASEVYNGTLSLADSHLVITFTNPYVYNGGNLFIEFYAITDGDYHSANFYGVSSTGSSASGYNSSSTASATFNQRNFLPKVTFEYTPGGGDYCPRAGGFTVRNVSAYYALLGWTVSSAFEDVVSDFTIEYGEQGFEPGAGISLTTSEDSILIDGLESGVHYDAYIWTNCNNGLTSNFNKVSFFTPAEPIVDLPYSTGFEEYDDRGWAIKNATNGWYIDTAAFYTGEYGLYISADTGRTNSYTITSAGDSYAARNFTLDSGMYALGFDWRAGGEGNYDYLKVSLAPSSTDFTANTVSTAGWTTIIAKLNLNTEWTTEGVQFPVPANGDYYIVFQWHNDGSGGSQPPAAVDNVTLRQLTCNMPTNLEVQHVGVTDVTLSWRPGGDENEWAISVNGEEWFSVTDTTVVIDELADDSAYTFRVVSVCGGDDSSLVASVSAHTTQYCYKVTNVTVGSIGFTSAGISWTPSALGNPATQVTVSLTCNDSTVTEVPEPQTVTGNNVLFTGLQPGTSYTAHLATACDDHMAPDTAVVTFATSSCGEITGTTTNSYVPFYGLYKYGYTQTLYDASIVSAIESITGISYELSSTPSQYPTRTVDVYMGYTSLTSLSSTSYVPASALTLVAEDFPMDVSQTGWSTITFDTPFTPNGSGKLVVAVVNKTGSYSSFSWKAKSAPAGSSICWYTDAGLVSPSSPSGSTNTPAYIPNTKFLGNCNLEQCMASNLAVTGNTPSSIDLAWVANGTEDTWVLAYRPAGSGIWEEVSAMTSTEYTIDGLNPGLAYDIRLGSLCDEDTLWTNVVAYTACELGTLPYTNTFVSDLGPCWTVTSVTRNTSNYLSFTSTNSVAILPELPLSNVTIMMGIRGSAANKQLKLGVTADNGTTIEWRDTVTAIATEFNPVVSTLNGYDGDATRLVIGTVSTSVYVDYINIMLDASCLPVDSVVVSDIEGRSANVAYYTSGENETFQFSYRASGADAWTDSIVYESPVELTNLNPMTTYQVRVRPDCGDDTTFWTSTTFTTPCAAEYTPFFEDFETTINSCWNRYSGLFDTMPTLTTTTSGWNRLTAYVFTDGHYKVNIYGTGCKYWLVTPSIELGEDMVLNFDAAFTDYNNADEPEQLGDDDRFIVAITTDGGTHWTPIAVWDTSAAAGHSLGDIPYTGASYGVSLSEYNNQVVRIAFYGESTVSNADNDLHIDNVMIAGGGCNIPGNVTVSNLALHSADISWADSSADMSSYEVRYGRSSNIDDTSLVTLTTSATTVSLTGLSQDTRYYVWVRTNCGDDNNSPWTSRLTFLTPRSCYPPSTYSIDAVGYTTVSFSWGYNEDSVAMGLPITGTIVTIKNMSDTSVADIVETVTGTSLAVSDLQISANYRIYLSTLCDPDTANSVFFNVSTISCAEESTGGVNLSYVPFYGLYNYGYSQTIYPAEIVQHMDTIRGISYKLNSTPSSYPTRPVSVYLGATSRTSLNTDSGSFVPVEDLQLMVTNFPMDVSQTGWTTIMFDTFFVVDHSQDLLVAVQNNTGDYSSFNWSGHTVDSMVAVYWYRDASAITPSDPNNGSPSHSRTNIVPDVRFEGVCDLGSCLPPMLVIDSINTTTAFLTIVPGNEDDNWVVEYRQGGDTVWTSTPASGLTTRTITGLMASTLYEFRAGSLCDGDTLWASTIESYSECAPMAVPFTEDFSYGISPCWKHSNTSLYINSTTHDIYVRLDNANAYLKTPVIAASVDTLQVRLNMYTSTTSAQIAVGVADEDGNNIEWLDTVAAQSTSTFNEEVFFIHNYSGTTLTNRRIVIGKVGTSGYGYVTTAIVEPLMPCLPIRYLTVVDSATTGSSLTIDWEDIETAGTWAIEYGAAGFTPGSGTTVTVTAHPATVTGLTSSTAYDFYVTPVCAEGNGVTNGPLTVVTAYEPCEGGVIVENYTASQTQGTSSYSPIGYSLYNYSYVQTIVDSANLAELAGGDIVTFAFNTNSTSAGSYFTGMTVYMANVSESDLASSFIHPDSAHTFVEVISNTSFNYTETGWQYFNLTVPFTWDGHSNLLVAVKRNHGSWTSGSSFVAHNQGASKSRYVYQDSGPYDINTVTDGTATSTVGDIRLISCEGGPVPPTCDAPVITAVTAEENTATVTFVGEAANYEAAIVAGPWSEDDATSVLVPGTADTLTKTFTGLSASTNYTIGVRAVCDADNKSEWVLQTITTSEHACQIPTTLAVTNITFNGATLSWTAGEFETEWMVNLTSSQNNVDTTFMTTNNPLALTGLTPKAPYAVKIKALCSETQESDWTMAVNFTTDSCRSVNAPSVSGITSHSAVIVWSAGYNSNGSYQIEYGFRGVTQGNGTRIDVTGTSYTIDGLLDDAAYDVYVRSKCDEGIYSGWSPVAEFNTLEASPDECNAPANVNVSGVTVNSATITWDGTANQYEVEYGTTGFSHGAAPSLIANTNSINLTGLSAATTYDVYVRALCDNGNVSSWSAVRTFMTEQTQGIDEVNGNNVALYPNPATTNVTITGIEGQATVTIVDLNGREVKKAAIDNEHTTISLDGMAQGAYFVRIVGEQTNAIRKLIVR